MIGALGANLGWLACCLPDWLDFRGSLLRPEDVQRRILKRILRDNQDTAYGRKHAFARIQDAREYRGVPVTSYEDLEPWIERVKYGEPGVLTAEPVLMFEKTSGSSSAAKYIPYTASLRRQFQRAVRAWIFDLLSRRPGLLPGPQYWSITPIAREREMTRGGIPVGFESDAEYLGSMEQRLLRGLLAVPSLAARAPDLDAGLYITLRFLLQAPSLAFVSVWNPSFLTLLFERLQNEAERLIDDLEAGTLRAPRALPEGLAGSLKPLLAPDPRRARALRRSLSRKSRLEAADVWPGLGLISCWADASARLALPALYESFPGVEVQAKGLLATEGVVTTPLLGRGAALAVTSHFFEFLPAGGGEARLAHELEEGREYSPLLTTGGGLYRYELGDAVRVTGFEGRTPLLEFVGRSDCVSDLSGEKLSALFAERALSRLKRESMWSASFAMLAPAAGLPPGYTLYLEGLAAPDLAGRLDLCLRENPQYDYARRLGQLAAPRVFLVRHGAWAAYLRRCELLGQRAGNVKPAALSLKSGWEEFFEGGFVPGRERQGAAA